MKIFIYQSKPLGQSIALTWNKQQRAERYKQIFSLNSQHIHVLYN